MGTWWASWVSNPWCGANNVVGRFDSDAPPPFSLNSVSLNSVSLNSVSLNSVSLNSVSLPQFLCLSFSELSFSELSSSASVPLPQLYVRTFVESKLGAPRGNNL